MKNVYTYDLLNSIEHEEYAVELIKRLNEICIAGGFNLKKLISIKKNVLMNLHDIHRKKGVEDTYLEKEGLPTVKALVVNWEVWKRCFMFSSKPEGETKKKEKYAFYVDFLLWSYRLGFTIHPKGKINTARTVSRSI